MALSKEDRKEIAELVTEALTTSGTPTRGDERPDADLILPLIQRPHMLIEPGKTRSRYSWATLMDDNGRPVRRIRLRTSELRSMVLASFAQTPGVELDAETGEALEVEETS